MYEEDHSNALCPIDQEKSGLHMGERVEIQPMTATEMRQYFNEHAKKTHQLAIQLNQLMNVPSHHLPQPMQLTGPGMVSFSTTAGTTSIYS
jgi:hypothetical protein